MTVQEAAFQSVGQDFIVDANEDLGVKNFNLRAHSIGDAGDRRDHSTSFALEAMPNELTRPRQELTRAGCDLSQADVAVAPRQNVSGRSDGRCQHPAIALDLARSQYVEEFRMERPRIEMEFHVMRAWPAVVDAHPITRYQSVCEITPLRAIITYLASRSTAE